MSHHRSCVLSASRVACRAHRQARNAVQMVGGRSTFPFAGPALPVEIWDIVLDCFVGARHHQLLKISLVCRHWRNRCSPYLVRHIVFNIEATCSASIGQDVVSGKDCAV